MNENFSVFCLMLAMLIIAALVTGFTYGFVGFLLYVAGVGSLAWLWHRYVVCRPRVVACGAYVGEYLGGPCYLLEVA